MEIKKSKSNKVESTTPSARIVYERKAEILMAWVSRVKAEVATAILLANPVVIDTMPLFLDGLADALSLETSRETATEASNMAQEHGGERARITRYGPEQILQEYQILREVIRTEIKAFTPITERDDSVIQKSFDVAIQEAMIAYFLVHSHIREQFVATLTHDLRNPIGAIKMASEIISEVIQDGLTTESAADVLDLAKRITKNARRADRMIQDMLDASVVQIGEQPAVNIQRGDIETVVMEAVIEQPTSYAKRLVIESKSAIGHWDLDALQRSVENLISNAFKYGDEDRPITVRTEELHGRVMISVHNEGNPIPTENVESLFQVFRRAEAAKKSGKKGWGIGLALARTTAERMGGSLGVESSKELGTTFTIDIPSDARPFVDAPTS